MATSPFRFPSDTEVSDEDNHPDHKQWWEQGAPTRPKRGKKKKSPPCPWGDQGPIVTNPGVPNLPGGGDLPSEAYWAKAAKEEAKQEAAISRWEETQAQRSLKKRRIRQEED